MQKFKFRLERVLEYRNVVKKEKERELAMRHAELHEAEARLSSILAEQDGTQVPQTAVTMAELALTGDYLRYLQDLLVRQRLLVLQATQAVDAARDAYIEKALEAETLENVKEQRQAEYKDECRRTERKEMDKFTVQRYRFKSKFTGTDGESGGPNG